MLLNDNQIRIRKDIHELNGKLSSEIEETKIFREMVMGRIEDNTRTLNQLVLLMMGKEGH